MKHDPLFDLELDVDVPSRARGEPAPFYIEQTVVPFHAEEASAPLHTERAGPDSALLSLFMLARRHAGLICACAIGVSLAAFLLSTQMADRYSSTASLLFRQSELVGQVTGFAEEEQFDTVEEEGATHVAVVESRPIAAETSRRMGGDHDVASVEDAITVEARPNTGVVDVTAEAGAPADAVRLANTFTDAFVDRRTRQVRNEIRAALGRLEQELELIPSTARDGAVAGELEQRISTLRVLNAVQSPNVERIQRAQLPDEPTSPRPMRNAVLGLLFGLLLGLGLAALDQHRSNGRARLALR